MKVHILAALETNYFFVLESEGKAIALDPGDAAPIIALLESQNLDLEAIWLTHHHWDHVDGVEDLLRFQNVKVFAPEHDLSRIPCRADGLREGDQVVFGGEIFKVLELPGHTLGSLAFYNPSRNWLFSADTLFSLGCGRLFEGTPEQMMKSLNRIKSLPKETEIYFSHEYTLKNLEFLKSIQEKVSLKTPIKDLEKAIHSRLSKDGKTVPSRLEFELKNNPFLNADLEVFTTIRALRNQF